MSDKPTLSSPLYDIGQVTLRSLDMSPHSVMNFNADASKGEIRVELLDPDGYRTDGFTFDEAVPIKGDSLSHSALWRGGDLSDIEGDRLARIHLSNAELFALSLD